MQYVVIQTSLMSLLQWPSADNMLTIYVGCALMYASYFAFWLPNFLPALLTSMTVMLVQSFCSLWMSVRAKTPPTTMKDVSPILPLFVINCPVMEEVMFRYLFPQHLNWIANTTVTSLVCSVLFGLWHITNLQTFRVLYKGLPPSNTLLLLASQIFCAMLLGQTIVSVDNFVAGVVLHMCYNVGGMVVHICGRWLHTRYISSSCQVVASIQPISKALKATDAASCLVTSTVTPMVEATPAELTQIFVSSIGRLHTRRRSEPYMVASKQIKRDRMKRNAKEGDYISKRDSLHRWTMWHTLETQLALQQHRHEERQWGNLRSLAKDIQALDISSVCATEESSGKHKQQ